MCNEFKIIKVDGEWFIAAKAIGGGHTIIGAYTGEWPPRNVEQMVHVGMYPDSVGPIVRLGENNPLVLSEARWGWPSWKAGERPITNVRNYESSFWKPWLKKDSRCLVPVSEFCEWTDSAPKQKRWFKLKDDAPFMFAGIWREWEGVRGTKKNPVSGKHIVFAFMTTDPNPTVHAVHAKAMPVMLTPEYWMAWLTADVDAALAMLHAHPDEDMAPPRP